MGLHTQQVRLPKASVTAIGAGNYKPGFLYIATNTPYELAYGMENGNLSGWINPATLGVSTTFTDTATIDFTLTGSVLTAAVKLSTNPGNAITSTATGIFAQSITVAPSSANYIDLTAGVLSLKSLGIINTTTNTTSTSLAAGLTAAGYAAATLVYQNSDMLILTAATGGTQIWLHNGGVSGTTADFTQIEAPPLTPAFIRSQVSGTAPVAYNATTGAVSLSFNSGLQNVGGVLRLGGPLLQDTTYTGAFRYNINTTQPVSIGGTTGVSKLHVFGGDIEVDSATNGLVLKNGTARWRITVDANGSLVTTSI